MFELIGTDGKTEHDAGPISLLVGLGRVMEMVAKYHAFSEFVIVDLCAVILIFIQQIAMPGMWLKQGGDEGVGIRVGRIIHVPGRIWGAISNHKKAAIKLKIIVKIDEIFNFIDDTQPEKESFELVIGCLIIV